MKKMAVVATLLVLGVLYTRLDLGSVLQRLQGLQGSIFALALACFIPQGLVTVWRWQWMVADVYPMGTLEAIKLIMAGKALNALLPSKLGETSKAYLLKTHAEVPLPQGVALVMLEKILDVAGLCTMMLGGLLLHAQRGAIEALALLIAVAALSVTTGLVTCRLQGAQRWLPRQGHVVRCVVSLLENWDAILARWRKQHVRFAGIVGLSCLLWGLHLVQITLFFLALHSQVPLRVIFAYVPLSIFIGLLPLTLGGMGTRDSALILLFAPYENAVVMASIGVLCSLRYWLDSLVGLPFFYAYTMVKSSEIDSRVA
jgi:uncharacterized protein (TIRG00374 family)